MHLLRKFGALTLLAALFAGPAQASFIWNEIGAGQLPGTAEITAGSGFLSQINGHLNYDGNTSLWGVDLYAIRIVDGATFTASTAAGSANMDDPALYLFDSSGMGLYMNNDSSLTDFNATLPTGSAFGPVSAGLYYLGIAWGFSDALSFDSIFSLDQFLDTTGVYGPTGPGGAVALASWNAAGPVNFDLPSDYTINLRGAVGAIPEPGTLALVLVAAAGAIARRRRFQ
ncbi:MAG: PEP-CTERM sorting domain-containing protein [Betaproteobacteria bacterium]